MTLALSSSFEYAYYAAYLHRMSEDQIQILKWKEDVYQSIFAVDTLIHILLDEHNYLEGKWTLWRSLVRQVKGGLLRHVLAIIPFYQLLDGKIDPFYCQLTYLIKVIRLQIGLELMDYKKMIKQLHELQKRRVHKLMANPKTAENMRVDSANITFLMRMSQAA